jgi:hypothetical protein
MRFTTQLLLGLAAIFTTMIAVEGLPPGSSPSPSPQVNESPAKQQTTKKKGFWPWSKAPKATPTTSPMIDVGKTKKPKKQTVDIPAEGPAPVAKPRPPHETTAKPTPYPIIGVRESATPAPGGGPGMVWVNTKTHVYHSQKSRWYGTTKEGKYMSEEEAKADGNRPSRTSD